MDARIVVLTCKVDSTIGKGGLVQCLGNFVPVG